MPADLPPASLPTNDLTPAQEDYLETIYELALNQPAARVSQIAQKLSVNKSSVTGALKQLAAKGFVSHNPYQFIELTPSGVARAKEVVRRHEVLKKFFTHVLGVDEDQADQAACHMEHHLQRQVLARLLEFVQFADAIGVDGKTCHERFDEFRQTCLAGKFQDKKP
jgi:DtxR family Mn-dependent transcriptional regulator